MKAQNKTISLVLGSGGARGLAHIGVIRYLEEQGYQIRSISGTSIGALIGGIYATGKLDPFTYWVSALEKLDIVRLLDLSFTLSKGGILRGERIMSTLRKLIGEHTIEDLPIRYTAVACDLKRQREVWLNRGDLFTAIRASIAIPTLFTPVSYEGRILVDGGVVNPVPVAPALSDHTELIIAVDASAGNEVGLKPIKQRKQDAQIAQQIAQQTIQQEGNSTERPHLLMQEQISSFINNIYQLTQRKQNGNDEAIGMDSLAVLTRSFESMQALIARYQMASNKPDILIKIPNNISTFYEFHHAKALIEFGYQRAQETLLNE